MIRSQIITLRVIYNDEAEPGIKPKEPPAGWNWDALVDEPIQGAVEVLAAGPVIDHPRPGESEG